MKKNPHVIFNRDINFTSENTDFDTTKEETFGSSNFSYDKKASILMSNAHLENFDDKFFHHNILSARKYECDAFSKTIKEVRKILKEKYLEEEIDSFINTLEDKMEHLESPDVLKVEQQLTLRQLVYKNTLISELNKKTNLSEDDRLMLKKTLDEEAHLKKKLTCINCIIEPGLKDTTIKMMYLTKLKKKYTKQISMLKKVRDNAKNISGEFDHILNAIISINPMLRPPWEKHIEEFHNSAKYNGISIPSNAIDSVNTLGSAFMNIGQSLFIQEEIGNYIQFHSSITLLLASTLGALKNALDYGSNVHSATVTRDYKHSILNVLDKNIMYHMMSLPEDQRYVHEENGSFHYDSHKILNRLESIELSNHLTYMELLEKNLLLNLMLIKIIKRKNNQQTISNSTEIALSGTTAIAWGLAALTGIVPIAYTPTAAALFGTLSKDSFTSIKHSLKNHKFQNFDEQYLEMRKISDLIKNKYSYYFEECFKSIKAGKFPVLKFSNDNSNEFSSKSSNVAEFIIKEPVYTASEEEQVLNSTIIGFFNKIFEKVYNSYNRYNNYLESDIEKTAFIYRTFEEECSLLGNYYISENKPKLYDKWRRENHATKYINELIEKFENICIDKDFDYYNLTKLRDYQLNKIKISDITADNSNNPEYLHQACITYQTIVSLAEHTHIKSDVKKDLVKAVYLEILKRPSPIKIKNGEKPYNPGPTMEM